jgi:hypothetical protein
MLEIKHQFNDKEIIQLKQIIDPYINTFNKELKAQFSAEEIEKLNGNLYDDEENDDYKFNYNTNPINMLMEDLGLSFIH